MRLLDFVIHICKFQSTLPARGATLVAGYKSGDHIISIHAPRTGSDRRRLRSSTTRPHFNPRSPHGERHYKRTNGEGRCNFNPRSPHGERPTRMVRYCCAELISIHAPRTGSDCKSRSKRLSKRTFQSTLPARGATDPLTNVAISCGSISIHAPRTGSDRNTSHTISTQEHFNPRSPHGERHLQALKVVTDKAFQSTLPARGATGRSAGQLVDCTEISIHAPRTGSD